MDWLAVAVSAATLLVVAFWYAARWFVPDDERNVDWNYLDPHDEDDDAATN